MDHFRHVPRRHFCLRQAGDRRGERLIDGLVLSVRSTYKISLPSWLTVQRVAVVAPGGRPRYLPFTDPAPADTARRLFVNLCCFGSAGSTARGQAAPAGRHGACARRATHLLVAGAIAALPTMSRRAVMRTVTEQRQFAAYLATRGTLLAP